MVANGSTWPNVFVGAIQRIFLLHERETELGGPKED